MKPKILIIVDVPGWALDRTADNVISRLKKYYNFEKIYNKDAKNKIQKGNFDLLYITYWKQLQDAGIQIPIPRHSITGVRSHFKWDSGSDLPPSNDDLAYLNQFAAINVPSLILYNIFNEYNLPIFYTPHGVDHKIFIPHHDKTHSPTGKLTIGWAGSSTNHPGKRGLVDFIFPSLNELSGITLKIADRESEWRSQEVMVNFYQGIDAYICASRTEGGPHPLLEASACGIPIITTRVGIAPDLIELNKNGIIIDRSINAIRNAVILLRDNRDLRIEMGKHARKIICEKWTWDTQVKFYIPFFDSALMHLS